METKQMPVPETVNTIDTLKFIAKEVLGYTVYSVQHERLCCSYYSKETFHWNPTTNYKQFFELIEDSLQNVSFNIDFDANLKSGMLIQCPHKFTLTYCLELFGANVKTFELDFSDIEELMVNVVDLIYIEFKQLKEQKENV